MSTTPNSSEPPPCERLRIGLLLDSLVVPAWAHSVIEQIVRSEGCELAVVVVNTAVPGRRSSLAKLWRHRNLLLYLGYTAIDRRLFQVSPDAFAETDASQLIRDVPRLDVEPIQTRHTDTFPAAAVEMIQAAELDVIVRLGFRILKGDILSAARCGVWSYHHGDEHRYRGGPPGFWEVMERNPVTGSMLQILSEKLDDGLVLASSHAGTDPTSVRRNQNGYFWKSVSFLPRKLAELQQIGRDEFSAGRESGRQHRTLTRTPFTVLRRTRSSSASSFDTSGGRASGNCLTCSSVIGGSCGCGGAPGRRPPCENSHR